jgi:hypothetical protein
MFRAGLLLIVVGLLAAAAFGQTAGAVTTGELFYGVDTKNRLVTFTGQFPSSITRTGLTGLPAGEQIVGLDVRPANKQLVALGSSSRLYQIDVATGNATAIGSTPFATTLAGASFGFDFNPTVDRIRITSGARQNLRVHPDTGAVAAIDGTLTYATGDPGAGSTPRIVASAYTNSVAGATTTQLFNLDAARDVLVLQSPPNNGTLVTIGSLGVDIGDNASFDISATDGAGYAAAQAGAATPSNLYRVDLRTGAATIVGRIGGGAPLRALVSGGIAPADTTQPALALGRAVAPARVDALLRAGVRLRASCSEGCTLSARVLSGNRTVATARDVTTDLVGSAPLRVVFSPAAKTLLGARQTLELTLVITARDASGNLSTERLTIDARR